MKVIFKPDKNSIKPVYQQLKDVILEAVKARKLVVGESVPSINQLCYDYKLAPGTVIRAYDELKQLGIISSRQGKGYFIAGNEVEEKTKVFLLFDRMNSYKEILYDAFLSELGGEAEVNVFFHHYEVARFAKLIKDNLGKYSHYVIMPHFNTDVSKTFTKIPPKKLVLIDNLPRLPWKAQNAVFQDFENDIVNGLSQGIDKIRKYKKVWLSLSKSRFQFVPDSCIQGLRHFCQLNQLVFEVVENLQFSSLGKNELYIVFSDSELIQFLKTTRVNGWKPGSDIGLISYDNTPVKEILAGGISVLSTDFIQMGKTAASMVKGDISGLVPNPFSLTDRGSF